MILRETMEILIFALIASYNLHGQQERVITEPEESQLFDCKALRYFAGNKSIRSENHRVIITGLTRLSRQPDDSS